jgi:hypothetical protein
MNNCRPISPLLRPRATSRVARQHGEAAAVAVETAGGGQAGRLVRPSDHRLGHDVEYAPRL